MTLSIAWLNRESRRPSASRHQKTEPPANRRGVIGNYAAGRRRCSLYHRARIVLIAALVWSSSIIIGFCQDPFAAEEQSGETEAAAVVVSATRTEIPLTQSPASTSIVTSEDIEQKQIERVADALREVPGLAVVQTGTAGQLTSVFTRGLASENTQVLLDGIPINQGLAGLYDFANLTTDNIDRIEVVRGPQSTLYGPRALAGVIQLFTKRGEGTPGVTIGSEGGSYGTFREWLESDGSIDSFDYSIGASRIDTDNARPNNQYRNSNVIADVGWSPDKSLRIGTVFTYSLSDTGNPNLITDPRPLDNFLTEKWLIAPRIDFRISDWWNHQLIVSYDHERQVNDPNEDGFTGPTRALFKRLTVDYQNDLKALPWLTSTSGFFYNEVDAGQERPFVQFGDTFISDYTTETAGFLELTARPLHNLVLVGGGRIDHFNQFGDVWTYRFGGNYTVDRTATVLHSSVATGFSPPSSQDKIFGMNPQLRPADGFGWDIGVEQPFWEKRIRVGATYFHNDVSNLVGFNGQFATLNLGAARTQGLEAELRATPLTGLTIIATYTYLDAVKTDTRNIAQPTGSRLPRRPRNEAYASASYLWCKGLRTTVAAKFVNAREELSFGSPNFDIEDYCLVSFAADYEVNPHLTVFGRIDNLTNEHFAEVFGFPALGRAVYGGVKVRF